MSRRIPLTLLATTFVFALSGLSSGLSTALASPLVNQVKGQTQPSGPAMPAGVPAARADILAQARKSWRRDAVSTAIRVRWAPAGTGVKPQMIWLEFDLLSPSNRHTATITSPGGPEEGLILEGRDADTPTELTRSIPDFRVDAPDAVLAARRAGLKEDFTKFALEIGDANGNPPRLVWIISTGDTSLPFVLDAQTGLELPWQQAIYPPKWTDAEMRAAWDRILNRNQPTAAGGGGGSDDTPCFSGVRVMYGMCMDSGGGFVDPYTGSH